MKLYQFTTKIKGNRDIRGDDREQKCTTIFGITEQYIFDRDKIVHWKR